MAQARSRRSTCSPGSCKPTRARSATKATCCAQHAANELVRAPALLVRFQDLRLSTGMSVLENVLVALPRQSGDRLLKLFLQPLHVRREDAANARKAMATLEFIGLKDRAFDLADDLSYAEEKLLVVARLIATEAEVLLFDEPLSGLDGTVMQKIIDLLRRLRPAATRRSASSSTVWTRSGPRATNSSTSTKDTRWPLVTQRN